MALVIGPNGIPNEIPDDVAACLVGDGQRGYAYAPAPKEPVRRTARSATK